MFGYVEQKGNVGVELSHTGLTIRHTEWGRLHPTRFAAASVTNPSLSAPDSPLGEGQKVDFMNSAPTLGLSTDLGGTGTARCLVDMRRRHSHQAPTSCLVKPVWPTGCDLPTAAMFFSAAKVFVDEKRDERMSPANRPLPPLPDEAEAKRQQVRPRPARPPLSASPPHDRSNAVNARPPQVIATATVATAIIARPRVPRMGTWSPHSLQHQQQSRASGEILLNNSKLENLKAHEAGTGGLRESYLLVKSVPTDHAYAEYLTISPQLPHSQTSTFHIAAGSDDGYTSLNNPPSEEGKEESKPPKKQPVNAKDLPRDPSHHRRTSRRRRVRVLVKRVPRPSSSSCRWSSTSDATTVSCIDDLYRLRLRRASSRQRDDSKEQQWRHQQQHSARAHRMKPRRNHQSPSYITKLPGDHRAACLGRPKRETTTSVTAAPSTRQSTKTPTSPPQPPLGVDASTVPSPVSRPENISLSLAPPLHNHALFRRHRRSSSCRYHRSQRPSQVSEKTELEMAGCGEADLVYEVVHSDTETTATTTEREEDEDLQPLLAGEEGTGADVAYAKRFLYSNYSENTLPAAHGAARQTINAPTRPRRSANTVRRRPMQYDSCTMITMLVV
ncbi:unnamed protein product [Schistocephalus solidus]|uniref:Uncharacterized protein n=1 Tax=Schistocephalus solidus TaxID=70667 RepID=A0A183SWN4_SCHSO|nr:unnamed protein product [Schistocephalus solidus]